MATSFPSLGPNSILSPFVDRTRTLNPVFHRTHFGNLPVNKSFSRGVLGVARFGLGQVPFPDPENAELLFKDLFARAEGLFYTVADVAVSASADTVADTTESAKQNSDWLSGITNAMEAVLKVLKDGLSTLHVPYSFGFAIILLTVLVKAATFPLTKKQVESAMAMRSMAPQIKAIQERYAGDQERIQLETARLYKLAGINPLAGCLPTLATIPIWIGLYRALSNVANEGLLTEGFFWIPSLAGPTTIAARQTGSGTSWLFPFVDGHPPLGWSDTFAYLALPVLLVLTQYISIQIIQPAQQSDDPNVKNSQAITKFLPLVLGYFSLSVPSGLSLYWFTNNILSTTQQLWLQKFGGANISTLKLSDDTSRKEQPWGAKIPTSKLTDENSRKEQPQIHKSISEAAIAKKKDGNPTSDKPRQGERFKQLKEQEARRRQQREGEKRRAEVAANRKEDKSAEMENRIGIHSMNGDSTSRDTSTSKNYQVVNGDSASLVVKEDKRIQTGEISDDDHNLGEGRHVSDGRKKGETVGSTRATDHKPPREDSQEDRGECTIMDFGWENIGFPKLMDFGLGYFPSHAASRTRDLSAGEAEPIYPMGGLGRNRPFYSSFTVIDSGSAWIEVPTQDILMVVRLGNKGVVLGLVYILRLEFIFDLRVLSSNSSGISPIATSPPQAIKVGQFIKLNPLTFTGVKMEEDLQGFLDEMEKIFWASHWLRDYPVNNVATGANKVPVASSSTLSSGGVVSTFVTTPGDSVIAKRVYRRCVVSVGGRQTLVDLFKLDMVDFDIIEMDWLHSCYASLDYRTRNVISGFPGELVIEWKGGSLAPRRRFIYFLRDSRLISKDCLYHLVWVKYSNSEGPSLHSVPVVVHEEFGSLEKGKRELMKDIHRMANLGVRLLDSKDEGVMVQEMIQSSLGAEIKEKKIFSEVHESRYVVHLDSIKMYHDLKEMYWWNNMKRDVADFVAMCLVCQQVKVEHIRPGGLYQEIVLLE
ncbi:ALBINO3-like protein 1, chloroplastic [Capsicum annuum]|nr:ALBINO3-like protein 1, chloroplastic [Capsicum annuum]